MRWRRSSRLGKELPLRSLGMARSRPPAWGGEDLVAMAVAVASAVHGVLVPVRTDPTAELGSARSAPAACARRRCGQARSRPRCVVTPAGVVGQTGTRPSGTSRLNWPFTREICTVACPIRREQRPSPDARPGHPPAHIRHTHGDWLYWSRCSAARRLNPGMTTAAPRSAIRCRLRCLLGMIRLSTWLSITYKASVSTEPRGMAPEGRPSTVAAHGMAAHWPHSILDRSSANAVTTKKAQLRGYTPRHHYRSCTLDLRIAIHRMHVSD